MDHSPSPLDGDLAGGRRGLPPFLSALEHQNFRLVWLSQLARGTSLWLQLTTVPLLAVLFGGSALDLGIIVGLQYGPVLLFGPLGGVLADRLDKHRALVRLQVLVTVLALIFAVLTTTRIITIGYILILAAAFGLATSIEMPIRQAFLAELVPRNRLPNAIVLQQAALNTTRLLGPATAGLLVVVVGFGATFAIAGSLNLVATLLMLRMNRRQIDHVPRPDADGIARSLAAGLRYVMAAPRVRTPLLVLLGATTFALGILAVLPIYATDLLALDSLGYGLLLSAFGAGGVLGAAPMSLIPSRAVTRSIPIALMGAAGAMLTLGIASSNAAFPVISLLGFCAIVVFGSTNVLVQLSLDDRVRGRVMGIYVAIFSGGTAIGGILTGALAQQFGIRTPFAVCAAALAILGVCSLFVLHKPDAGDSLGEQAGDYQASDSHLHH